MGMAAAAKTWAVANTVAEVAAMAVAVEEMAWAEEERAAVAVDTVVVMMVREMAATEGGAKGLAVVLVAAVTQVGS